LLDVLVITDGSLVFKHCALGIAQCNAERPCPLHHDFAVCRDGMLELMSSKTIGQLADEVVEGNVFLAR
jgi:DNA-binding IscR family transcriptional regulator